MKEIITGVVIIAVLVIVTLFIITIARKSKEDIQTLNRLNKKADDLIKKGKEHMHEVV